MIEHIDLQTALRDVSLISGSRERWRYQGFAETADTDVLIEVFDRDCFSNPVIAQLATDLRLRARIEHPSLTGIIEYGLNDRWLWSLYREGHFEEASCLTSAGQLSVIEVLQLGIQIADGLEQLHSAGVIHKEIRTRNVYLQSSAEQSRYILFGQGLLGLPTRPGERIEEDLEAAHFQSPEQSGLIDHDLTNASDLYSLGMVMFAALAGRTPFEGTSMGAILHDQATKQVPPLALFGLEVPEILDKLFRRLLSKDPRDRYQTAAGLKDDLEAIAAGLVRGDGFDAFTLGTADTIGTVTEPALVGRSKELGRIEQLIQQTGRGSGGLQLIEAESGGGKSFLLRRAIVDAQGKELSIHLIRPRNDGLNHPAKLLDELVQQYRCRASRAHGDRKADATHLEVDYAALACLLPAFRQTAQLDHSSGAMPGQFSETRTVNALANWLCSLGTAEHPVVLVFDDAQWLDDLTLKTIRAISTKLNSRDSETTYVSLICAFRSDEVGPSHELRRLDGPECLTLRPLPKADIGRLAESMAGRLPRKAHDIIANFADGSPFMASALVRGLIESEMLKIVDGEWNLDEDAARNLQSSSEAATILAQRFDLLPPGTVRLLSTAAVVGKTFSIELLAHVTGKEVAVVLEGLREARYRRLIWLSPDGSRGHFVHDQIRAQSLQRLDPKTQSQIHSRLARHLSRATQLKHAEIAFHYDAAGESVLALCFAWPNAASKLQENSFDEAEFLYRIALKNVPQSDRSIRAELLDGLAEVLSHQGKYLEAKQKLEQAMEFASGRRSRAEILSKLSELDFRNGDMESAVAGFLDALRMLGLPFPEHPAGLLLNVFKGVISQTLHSLFPRFFIGRQKRCLTHGDRLELRLLSQLAHGGWYARSKLFCLAAHLQGMNQAERLGARREIALFYAEHAPVMAILGLFGRGRKYAIRSLRIREQLGDRWGQGQALVYLGVVNFSNGAYHACIDNCREAIRLLTMTGDFWQVHIARYQIAASFYHLGEMEEAVIEARKNYRSGIELEDELASSIILDVWARADADSLPEEILRTERERKRKDAQSTVQILLASGVWQLKRGTLDLAVKELKAAVAAADEGQIHNAYTLPAHSWYAAALRIQAAELPFHAQQQRTRLLRMAEKSLKRALRSRYICSNELAHALREYALVRAMQGQRKKAFLLLKRSIKVAAGREARADVETGEALRLALESGRPWIDRRVQHVAVSNELKPEAKTEVSLSRRATLSLVDRFDTLVHVGHSIASSLTQEEIYERARSAAQRLLHSEYVMLLEVLQHDEQLTELAPIGAAHHRFHRGFVRRALLEKHAVCWSAAGQTSRLGEKSCLCVPIYVRSSPVACLYLAHCSLREMFGEDEQRIADFIAVVAGAALENADNFGQLKLLNETLEQRVSERTAAAEAKAWELAIANRELKATTESLLKTEEELRVAKDAAESASRAKSAFLATMSHEVRTPMNGILGMADLALNTTLTTQQQKYLTTIRRSGDNLLRLLNDVLDLSKIEAGRIDLECIDFKLTELLQSVVPLMAATAAGKDVEVLCDWRPEVPDCLTGDPTRLRQVLINLMGNAIKFTETGTVVLKIAAQQCDDRHWLAFSVIDTGPGIPENKRQRVFESFHQTDASTTRRYGGTGLGLTISAELVELMGGTIDLESTVGAGSTFTARIPWPAGQESPVGANAAIDGKHVHICSPVDNARSIYRCLLQTAGAKVDESASVGELVEIVSQDSETDIATLICDVSRMDADEQSLTLETCRKLQQRGVAPILLFAVGDDLDWAEPLQLADSQLVSKPIIGRELLNSVEKLSQDEAVVSVGPCAQEAERAGSLRVLVVDDSEINRDVAGGLLELLGHQFDTACNGQEAVEMALAGRHDVVLMDLEMPLLDGVGATRLIREAELETGKHLPIIAVTAHAITGFEKQCRDAGMDSFVTKPFSQKDLVRIFSQVVPGGNAAETSATTAVAVR